MPAHITHEIFAREAITRSLDDAMRRKLDRNRASWVFGAQGPDFFLHNRRTRPSGLVFGTLLHSESYGAFVRKLCDTAIARGEGVDTPLGTFILGFVTHAMLDRKTHPYIDYMTGWVERGSPESVRYTNCHPFFERIVDVLILKLRSGEDIAGYDFHAHADLGESMDESIVDALAVSIEAVYPEYLGHRHTRKRIRNAYGDTMGFYRFTNPPERRHLELAFERDGGGGDPTKRFLALFHPDTLPDLDYLNGAHSTWNHPGNPEDRRSDSFVDLYEAALADATAPLEATVRALSVEASTEAVETAIGNGNLSDGATRKTRRKLEYIRPLPLDEVLAGCYERIERTITNR